jgi:hypothetical protein
MTEQNQADQEVRRAAEVFVEFVEKRGFRDFGIFP